MEQMQMIYVKELYSDNSWLFGTKDDVMKFIGTKANEMNYGMFRTWTDEGKTYFDCGPRTYVMEGEM